MNNLVIARGLSDAMLQDIHALEKICSQKEKLNFKLNWDMLNRRSNEESSDFLYYVDDKLVGFFGLYCIGPNPKVIETTGMVHPDYRKKGIFTQLYNAAKKECIARGAEKILLITERISKAGTGFAQFIDSQYSFSEYRMKFEDEVVPSFKNSGIILREARDGDKKELAYLDAICFGLPEADAESNYDASQENQENKDNPYDTIYIAELKGKLIGKIGVLMEGDDGYIFGFGIKPEYRRRGYGREVLSMTLSKLLAENVKTVILEVAVENEKALFLYESCGFKELTVYDYYEILLK